MTSSISTYGSLGGWVRDKLLGGRSQDIEVAFSSMTWARFGEALEDHFALLAAEGVSEAQGLGLPPTIKGLHKINSNPEKSKHLETGTIEIFGLSADFVNLRKETYTDRSRNSQVESDLAAAIIRTPLQPTQPLTDDLFGF